MYMHANNNIPSIQAKQIQTTEYGSKDDLRRNIWVTNTPIHHALFNPKSLFMHGILEAQNNGSNYNFFSQTANKRASHLIVTSIMMTSGTCK